MSQSLDFFETSQLGPQGWDRGIPLLAKYARNGARSVDAVPTYECRGPSSGGLRFLRMTNRGVHFGSLRSLRGMEPWNPTSRKNREKWGTLCRRGAYEYRDPSLGGLRLARRSPLPQDDKSRMCSLLLILFGRK